MLDSKIITMHVEPVSRPVLFGIFVFSEAECSVRDRLKHAPILFIRVEDEAPLVQQRNFPERSSLSKIEARQVPICIRKWRAGLDYEVADVDPILGVALDHVPIHIVVVRRLTGALDGDLA
jgi:hypothetical protein